MSAAAESELRRVMSNIAGVQMDLDSLEYLATNIRFGRGSLPRDDRQHGARAVLTLHSIIKAAKGALGSAEPSYLWTASEHEAPPHDKPFWAWLHQTGVRQMVWNRDLFDDGGGYVLDAARRLPPQAPSVTRRRGIPRRDNLSLQPEDIRTAVHHLELQGH